jgi:beta-mannosidase
MKKTVFLLLALFTIRCLWGQNNINNSLNGAWKLYYGSYAEAPSDPDELLRAKWPSIPSTVPGNVEIDLESAGIIKNPETGNNIYALRKFEGYQWWYFRAFDSPVHESGEKVEIIFEGLDCIGKIWINDQLIGQTANMLIEYRFDITDQLKKEGSNTVYVCIDPSVREGQKYTNGVIGSRSDFSPESVNIRKAPHMFGWDIMPRLVSAGLWRNVRIEVIKPVSLRQIYWMTNSVNIPQKKAELILDWEICTDMVPIEGLTMEISLWHQKDTVYRKSFPLIYYCGKSVIPVDNADFWWPRGYGDPVLYKGRVRLLDNKNRIMDEDVHNVGIRTAELIHTEITSKEHPGEFVFVVNGEKIFVRGTNWVPLDALHGRDQDHLGKVFSMAVDLNCNMIRCWGGNVYEDHSFFDLCDENGIMVWQDFAMGCTVYPQNDEFAAKIRNEAINIVCKLRNHPSLVLWSGNNENDASLEWNFSKLIDPGMDRISRDILPRVIWEFDPLRTYLPSSPYCSEEYFRMGKNPDLLPEVHLWGPRGYYKAPFYTNVSAHFVSEIGYHGCPDRQSLERMFDPGYVYPWTGDGKWNDEWQTKAVRAHPGSTLMDKRNDLMVKQVNALFGECPKDLDTFIFASQSVQAEAMKFFIEFWRMDKFRKTGIIWWNLRDGWPIISDAIVDYYNSKKLAYYYIKRVQTNTCIMIGDGIDGRHPVVAVNDTRDPVNGLVIVKDADSGKTLFTAECNIQANGKSVIGYIQGSDKKAMWLVDYSLGAVSGSNHYLNGQAPFKLDDYKRWFKKLNIIRD